MKKLPNIITIARILLSILLLILQPFSIFFIMTYIICGITDMLDGFIARATHTTSQLGANLDSIADTIFVMACLVKILPVLDIQRWLWIWLGIIIFIKVINILSGLIYHKKITFLHTFANKATGFILFLLPLTLTYLPFQYTAIFSCILATFAAIQEGHFIRRGEMKVKT